MQIALSEKQDEKYHTEYIAQCGCELVTLVTLTHVITETSAVIPSHHVVLLVALAAADHRPVPLDALPAEVALPGHGPVLVPVGHGVLDAGPAGPGAGGGTAGEGAGSHDLGDVGRIASVLVIEGPHQRWETGNLSAKHRTELKNFYHRKF